ncbi:PocR ligand-binding domain-containing protein [Agarivorans sp. QJM3NY_25]|uniref:PocR ligand-binding domain-containing protein n=1 Tax=Agarivorans sp. QJM3NY_25 TaxID=3421430 RepID=UPI003D7E6764
MSNAQMIFFGLFFIVASSVVRYFYKNKIASAKESTHANKIPPHASLSIEIKTIDEQLKHVSIQPKTASTQNNAKYSVKDLIDVELLQQVQDAFSNAFGVASITVDDQGAPITKPSNFMSFCMELNRGNPEGLKLCCQCDAGGGTLAANLSKPAIYRCHSGLVDFAVPIIIEDKQVGSIVGGQVLTEAPDLDKFRAHARKLNIDEDKYLEALSKVSIISPDKLISAAQLLELIAKAFSQTGLKTRKLLDASLSGLSEMTSSITLVSNSSNQIKGSLQQVATKSSAMSNTVKEISDNASKSRTIVLQAVEKVKHSTKQMDNLESAAQEIGMVLETISKISSQVDLLSLNAAIEAARAGDAGRGFAVVANEVKHLAGQTQDASIDIGTKIHDIQQASSDAQANISLINQVIKQVDDTVLAIESAVKTQANMAEEMSENILQTSTEMETVDNDMQHAASVAQKLTTSLEQSL